MAGGSAGGGLGRTGAPPGTAGAPSTATARPRLFIRPDSPTGERVRALLASLGVTAEEEVVPEMAAARAGDLSRLGLCALPGLALGDRVVCGWNPPLYAELVGRSYTAPVAPEPGALAARLDEGLAAAGVLIAAVSDGMVGRGPDPRQRTLGDLAFHVFRLGLAFADGMDMGRLRAAWFEEGAPPDLADGRAIARYGALVRGRLAGWFEGASPREYARAIAVDSGTLSGHDILEHTAWHAARHVHQLRARITALGSLPDLRRAGAAGG